LRKGIVRISPAGDVLWKKTFVVLPRVSVLNNGAAQAEIASLDEFDGFAKTLPDGTALLMHRTALLRIDLNSGCTKADARYAAAIDIDAVDQFTLSAVRLSSGRPNGTAAKDGPTVLDYYRFAFDR